MSVCRTQSWGYLESLGKPLQGLRRGWTTVVRREMLLHASSFEEEGFQLD